MAADNSANANSETIAEAKARGDAAFRAGRHAAAVEAYSAAIDLSERARDGALLHILLGNRAAARIALGGDWQRAAQDALQAADAEPTYAKAHYRAAIALERLGRGADALRAARHARALEPGSGEVAALVARLEQQQHEEADGDRSNSTSGGGSSTGDKAGLERSLHPSNLPAPPPDLLDAAAALAALPPELRAGAVFVPPPPPPATVAGAGNAAAAATGDAVANVLVLLHGLGDAPAPFAALARHMALPATACLALAGPIEVPETGGGRAWFEAFDDNWELIAPRPGGERGGAGWLYVSGAGGLVCGRGGCQCKGRRLCASVPDLSVARPRRTHHPTRPETRRIRSLERTVALLLPALARLAGALPAAAHHAGVPCRRRRVHLLGFSQGAAVALEVARRRPPGVWSVVSIAGALLQEHIPALEQQQQQETQQQQQQQQQQESSSGDAAAPQQPPLSVLLTHGDRDAVVPRDAVERTAALLRRAGCGVALHSVAGKGHAMVGPDRGEAAAVMRHFSRVLAAPAPAEGATEVGADAVPASIAERMGRGS